MPGTMIVNSRIPEPGDGHSRENDVSIFHCAGGWTPLPGDIKP